MKILAIDTSSEVCGVAILENENLIDDNSLTIEKTHSETLMPRLEELFNKNNLKLKEELEILKKAIAIFTPK